MAAVGWKVRSLLELQRLDGHPYLEFMPGPSMSVGLYVLPAGGVDRQSPHTEDEIYIVLGGRGRFTVGDDTRQVETGDILYVPAAVPHRFHDIDEELQLAVVFAPPEGSLADS